MKKIIALLLSLMMLLSLTLTSYAEEYFVDAMQTGYGQTEIRAHIYSSYVIEIPATIDLSQTETGTIRMPSANLEDGFEVRVFCSNLENDGIRMEHIAGSMSGTCYFWNENNEQVTSSIPLATFSKENTSAKNFRLQFVPLEPVAGDYVGRAEFYFDCTPV